MPMITASTGASLRFGARRAELPWQNITISPSPAPTLSTATIVFTPGRNFVGSFSSTNCGRSSSSLRPPMEGSFLVATTEPSTRARHILPRRLRTLRQHGFHVAVRTRNHVHADQFALDRLDRLRAGVGRGFHRGDIADYYRSHERVADLHHGPGQFHVGGLEHGVGAFHERDQAARFDHSYCLMCHN